jgi:hypothetical protein
MTSQEVLGARTSWAKGPVGMKSEGMSMETSINNQIAPKFRGPPCPSHTVGVHPEILRRL